MKFFAAFSTSSPITSVAIFDQNGKCIASAEEHAPQTASNAAINLLEQLMARLNLNFDHIQGYMADTGPGSFTGVKVGVMLTKTFAFASDSPVAGATSFDLIDPHRPCAIQIRKGYYICRREDRVVMPSEGLPEEVELGYGAAFEIPYYPHAKRFGGIFNSLKWISTQELLPTYMAEPNISQPKKPF